jgi:hypothetical protein
MKLLLIIVLPLPLFGCDAVPPTGDTAAQVKGLVGKLERAPVNPVKLHGKL